MCISANVYVHSAKVEKNSFEIWMTGFDIFFKTLIITYHFEAF